MAELTNDNFAPIDISAMSANLEQRGDGIWVSRNRSEISYPEEGNLHCLALETSSFWFEHRNQCILEVMRRCPPPGMVFDVGGGNGYVALGLQQTGIPVTLVEPGLTGVQNAAKRGVNQLICSTLEDAGFIPGSFPAAGVFDVLEHIEDQQGFLQNLYKLLIPGGRVYLTVPAFNSLWSVADEYAGHYRRYTKKELSDVLVKAGFRVEYSTYIFFMLPPPILLFRALPSRFGMRKQQDWVSYTLEHSQRSGLSGRLLRKMLGWELAQIRAGKAIPVGGSCLVAAAK